MQVLFVRGDGAALAAVDWPAGDQLPAEGSRVQFGDGVYYATSPDQWLWVVGGDDLLRVEIRLLDHNPLDRD